MGINIHTAATEWYKRPQDERFNTLAALLESAQLDRETCKRSIVPASDLRAIATNGALRMQGKTGTAANLTNWSFGQLAAIAGAPAHYIRTLPPDLAATCLNHGLAKTGRDNHALLLRNGGPADTPYTVRAMTSEKYSRVWDAPIIRHLQAIQDRDASWQLPMSWNNVREGAYRGDRDMFVYMTNGGSILEDPSLMKAWSTGNANGNGSMYRGIILRNSEVGAACLTVETFLFRFTCGNHIVWHAENIEKTSRRHIGLDSGDAEIMINRALRIAEKSARDDEQTIAKLADRYYAKTKDEIIARARKDGLTQTDAAGAFDLAQANEPNPYSVWGYVQGITRQSQTSANQDDRHTLDQLAGRILQRERIAVAA